jgi:hypothetical protein
MPFQPCGNRYGQVPRSSQATWELVGCRYVAERADVVVESGAHIHHRLRQGEELVGEMSREGVTIQPSARGGKGGEVRIA